LIKAEDEYSRSFLIDNIRVEKAHAEHWIWMGEGFGIPRSEMMAMAEGERPLLRDVQSLSDWIWFINAKGSLAEAVAATSFAIEGATGDLTRGLINAFEAYGSREGVTMNPRTTKWFRNHAKYDDDHPRIALQIVARYAQTERSRMKVMAAARRSLQLLNLALLTSSREYSPARERRAARVEDLRSVDGVARVSRSHFPIDASSSVMRARPPPRRTIWRSPADLLRPPPRAGRAGEADIEPPVVDREPQASMPREIMDGDDHRAESRGGAHPECPSRTEGIRHPAHEGCADRRRAECDGEEQGNDPAAHVGSVDSWMVLFAVVEKVCAESPMMTSAPPNSP